MSGHRPHCVVAALLLLSGLSAPCMAGDGAIRGDKLDMSVMFAYREADPDSWRPLFEEASRLLYNATNGQLQLGTVRVTSCGFAKDGADVWIMDNDGGALANVLGLSGIGHIYLSQVHKSTAEPAVGPFGLVHEIGHYAFGTYDEYKGIEVPARSALAPVAEQTSSFRMPNQFCVTDRDPAACVMDGGTTISPNNRRTEFCTHADGGLSTAHNPGEVVGGLRYVNAQEVLNGESCWDTIARTVGLLPPSDVDGTEPPGLDPLVWEMASADVRLILCLDVSSSMGGAQFERTIAAATEFIDLLHARKTIDTGEEVITLEGDSFALVTFAGTASVAFPLAELTGEAVRAAAHAALGEIGAVGSTDVAIALGTALGVLQDASTVPACSESIVLISDGIDIEGQDPESLVPGLVERGVKLFTVSPGGDTSEERLRELAVAAGGKYFRIDVEQDIPLIMGEVVSEAREGAQLFEDEDVLGEAFRAIPILIDGFGEEFTTVCGWELGSLDLVLQSPTGETIDVDSTDPRIEAFEREGFVYIRVVEPEEGMWIARLDRRSQEAVPYRFATFVESRAVSLVLSTDLTEYEFPAPVRLRADLVATVPVAGASVIARVRRPGNTINTIELFDDGDPAHADSFADDGSYGALYAAYSGDGIYTFEVVATNVDGTGPDQDLPFVEEGGGTTALPIPPFTRTESISIALAGAPPPAPGDLTLEPATLNATSHGHVVTARIELVDPLRASDIDPSTLLLNDVVPIEPWPLSLGDVDLDGVEDLMVKLDRAAVIAALPLALDLPVEVSGTAAGTYFRASGTISVFDPQDELRTDVDLHLPVPVGAAIELTWDEMPEPNAEYRGFVSRDGGETWKMIFQGETALTHTWVVTAPATTTAMLVVEGHSLEATVRQYPSIVFEIVGATTGTPAGGSPLVTRLIGVAPNPSRGLAQVTYSLANESEVLIEIFDVSGRRVEVLVDGVQPAGYHTVSWNSQKSGAAVPPGRYFYRFGSGDVRTTGEVLIVR
jgi:Mg-chelatase subunit ChlD